MSQRAAVKNPNGDGCGVCEATRWDGRVAAAEISGIC